jgi:hypothetical protein
MLGRSLRILLWTAAILAAGTYFTYAIRGLSGATPRDPVEATVLADASRFAEGQSPYREPASTDNAPMMPVFPLVVSLLGGVFDVHPWVARMVCMLAVILCAAIAGFLVRRETGIGTLGVASAGLLFMAQIIANVSRASAHPEPLMMLFVLIGIVALRSEGGVWAAIGGALALTVACFTHPSGLWFALAGLLYLVMIDRARMIAYILTLAVLVSGGQIALSWYYGPWFNYAAWDRLFQITHFDPFAVVSFLGAQLIGTLGVLSLSVLLGFALPIRPWRGVGGLWTWMGFAALVAGLIASQSTLTPAEGLRPAAIILALAGPISMQRVTQHLSAWPGSSRLGGQRVVHAALALQFLTLLAHVAPAALLLMI